MKPEIFVAVMAVGAGAIALWTDIRVPRLAPKEFRGVLLHTFAAFMALHFVAGWIAIPVAGPYPMAMGAVLGVALPSVAYAFLAGIWAIRMFQSAYAGMR